MVMIMILVMTVIDDDDADDGDLMVDVGVTGRAAEARRVARNVRQVRGVDQRGRRGLTRECSNYVDASSQCSNLKQHYNCFFLSYRKSLLNIGLAGAFNETPAICVAWSVQAVCCCCCCCCWVRSYLVKLTCCER